MPKYPPIPYTKSPVEVRQIVEDLQQQMVKDGNDHAQWELQKVREFLAYRFPRTK